MSYVLCQRCAAAENPWSIKQAEFHVNRINRWKIQLCRQCAELVERAVLAALCLENPALSAKLQRID